MKFWVGSRKRPTRDGFSKLKMGFSLCRSSPQPSFSWLPSFLGGIMPQLQRWGFISEVGRAIDRQNITELFSDMDVQKSKN